MENIEEMIALVSPPGPDDDTHPAAVVTVQSVESGQSVIHAQPSIPRPSSAVIQCSTTPPLAELQQQPEPAVEVVVDSVLDDILAGRVDKQKICVLISGSDSTSLRRRVAFVNSFDFVPPLMLSLRRFLAAFTLTGETQQQDRVLHSFAERYCQCVPSAGGFDIVYQLVYSCILLNTDLYMAGNTRRMTSDQYVSNTLASIQASIGGSSLSLDDLRLELEGIYLDISSSPILQSPASATTPSAGVTSPSSSTSTVRSLMRGFTIRSSGASSRSSKSRAVLPAEDEDNSTPPLPFREGLLARKSVMDDYEHKSFDRKWHMSYCRVVASDLLVYAAPPSIGSVRVKSPPLSPSGSMQLLFHLPLRHALASSLPAGTYSSSRAFVFQLELAHGELHLFQTYTGDACVEWCRVLNYWAALESREPLSSGFGLWYGVERSWLLDFVCGGREEEDLRNPQPVDDDFELDDASGVDGEEGDGGAKEPAPYKYFDRLSDASIGVYTAPVLPFVPASLASTVEEVTLLSGPTASSSISHLYHVTKPLGFSRKKIRERLPTYQMWRKRMETLSVALENLVAAREILRCFGVGRGVVDATALDDSISLSWRGLKAKNVVVDVPSNNSSVASFKSKVSPMKQHGSVSSFRSTDTRTHSESGDWRYEHHQLYSAVPEGVLAVENHFSLVIHDSPISDVLEQSDHLSPRSSSLVNISKNDTSGEKSFPVMLPPPLNLLINVPPLPDAVMDALMSVDTLKSIPNFMNINRKLAMRVDANWQVMFRYFTTEIIKSYHYCVALQQGSEFTPLSQSLTNLVATRASNLSLKGTVLNDQKPKKIARKSVDANSYKPPPIFDGQLFNAPTETSPVSSSNTSEMVTAATSPSEISDKVKGMLLLERGASVGAIPIDSETNGELSHHG